MTFLHIAFLGGAAAIVVPLVLHLIMRQQPKHLEFPALRFIKMRETANRRHLKLRHWLLLALRAAIIGLLALALARPSILASGMLGDQEAPLAAALVFDTNPRMQYRQQNKTRLEVAQETAAWLLPQFPAESDVAVVDSRSASAAFAVDLGAARQRIERLDAASATQSLAAAIESAIKLVEENEKPRKEVYIFTDLAKVAWTSDGMRDLARQFKSLSGVGIYVIDVGVPDPTDFGLTNLKLSGDVLSTNSALRLTADLVHVGAPAERGVELYLVDGGSQKPDLRAQQQFNLQPGGSQRIDFSLLGLSPGIHQGYLKIVGEDALPCDDAQWFSVEVRPSWRVLIAAPQDAKRKSADYAFFLSLALLPGAFEREVISTEELAGKSLDGYAAVCLVDPRPLPADVWQKLHSFVVAGGGLGVFLGRNATPVEAFNEPVAQELLPAKLVRQWRGEVTLAPENYQHPAIAKFRTLEAAWELLPVLRHWQLGPLADGATVVVPFSNGQPALVERPVGKGRVLTLTTPISDTLNRPDYWNLLPTGEDKAAFVTLGNEMLFYLVGSGQQRLNYTAGETAIVHLGSAQHVAICSLTTPRGDQLRTPVDEKQNAIVVTSTEVPGNYRIQAGGGAEAVNAGFSVNLPTDCSQLQRATMADLQAVFGETEFRLAHNREEIDRSVSAARVGQELFPYLIVLLAIILGCEQVLSNRFYQDHDTSVARSLAAQFAQGTATARMPGSDAATKSAAGAVEANR